MGAFHAANEFFKHPDVFTSLIAMSGSYDIRGYCDGYWDNNCYFNNPVDYLVNLHDDWYLSHMRRNRIVIASGQGAYEAPDRSRQLSALLHAKAIPHWLDLWGYDVPHDWPTWRQMLNVYLPQLY
jgi:esterase/lipase superfamily enzyme